MTMKQIYKLEEENIKRVIEDEIKQAKHRNQEALINAGIQVVIMQHNALIMGMFGGVK